MSVQQVDNFCIVQKPSGMGGVKRVELGLMDDELFSGSEDCFILI
jgi:hypothetical protein